MTPTEALATLKAKVEARHPDIDFGQGGAPTRVLVVGLKPLPERYVKTLRRVLVKLGEAPEDCYTTALYKTPEFSEDEALKIFSAQVAILTPRVIFAAGEGAAQLLTGSSGRISELRSVPRLRFVDTHSSRVIPVAASWSPKMVVQDLETDSRVIAKGMVVDLQGALVKALLPEVRLSV